jgi:hypothetical protein
MFNILQRFDITDGGVKVTSYVVRVAGSTDEALEEDLGELFETLNLDSKLPFKEKLLEVVKVFGDSFARARRPPFTLIDDIRTGRAKNRSSTSSTRSTA